MTRFKPRTSDVALPTAPQPLPQINFYFLVRPGIAMKSVMQLESMSPTMAAGVASKEKALVTPAQTWYSMQQ